MEATQATIVEYVLRMADNPWTYALILVVGLAYLASFFVLSNGWLLRRVLNMTILFAVAGGIGLLTTKGASNKRTSGTSETASLPGSEPRATPRHDPLNITIGGSEEMLRNLRLWRADKAGNADDENAVSRWFDNRMARRQRRFAEIPKIEGYDHWKRGHALLTSHRIEPARFSFQAARNHFAERVKTQPTNENRYGAAISLEGIGISAQRQGRHDEAILHLNAARAELQGIDDPAAKRAVAAVSLSLADVRNERNEGESARQLFREAITVYESLQDTISATWRRATGQAYLRYGKFEIQHAQHNAAADALSNAGRHFSAVNASDENVLVFLAQAELDLAKGRFDEARHRVETARQANKMLQRWDIEISSMLLLSRLHVAEGKLDQAAASIDAARLVLAGLGDDIEVKSRLAKANIAASEIHFRRGRADMARQLFEEALVTHRAMFDHRGEAQAFSRLAQFEASWGGPAQAIAAYNQAFLLLRRLGDLRELALLDGDARNFCTSHAGTGRGSAVVRFCRGRETASSPPLPPSSAIDETAGPSRRVGGPQ